MQPCFIPAAARTSWHTQSSRSVQVVSRRCRCAPRRSQARMCVSARTRFRTNLETLSTVSGTSLQLLAFKRYGIRHPTDDCVIDNVEGKKASFAILANIALECGGYINKNAAEKALGLYAELVEEAKKSPGSHPTIDMLLRVVEEGLSFVVKIDGAYLSS